MGSPSRIARYWARPGSSSIAPSHHSATCGRAVHLRRSGRSGPISGRKSISREYLRRRSCEGAFQRAAVPFAQGGRGRVGGAQEVEQFLLRIVEKAEPLVG